MIDRLREPPPTAGLALSWRDFLPGSTSSLEQKIADFIGVPEVQIECSGTAALVVALLTLKNMSQRRSVVISAYTCPWVALAVVQCGLTPVVCDLRKNHFEFCLQSLAAVCTDDTLAVIPTHLAGRVADLDEVRSIAGSVGAYLVEDAAQSFGALHNAQPVGTLGDIGFYSLGVGKGLTIFAGGVLVARDEKMRRALRRTSALFVRDSFAWEIRRIVELVGYYLLYRPLGLGLAFGMPLRRHLKKSRLLEAVGDDCALPIPLHRIGKWRKAVGAKAFTRFPDYVLSTRMQAERRIALLGNIPGVTVIADTPGNQGVWPFLLVLMPSKESRDAALDALWQQGLGVGRLFIHALAGYEYLAGYFAGAHTPNATDFAERLLIVTNTVWLREKDFIKICAVLTEQARHA
jgi:perosamine synthetase